MLKCFFFSYHQLRYDGTSDLATVESYDPITNSWQPEVSMGTRRSCLGVAVLHGLLYAAGGYDGASCLNRYLRTDTMTSKVWGKLSKCPICTRKRKWVNLILSWKWLNIKIYKAHSIAFLLLLIYDLYIYIYEILRRILLQQKNHSKTKHLMSSVSELQTNPPTQPPGYHHPTIQMCCFECVFLLQWGTQMVGNDGNIKKTLTSSVIP